MKIGLWNSTSYQSLGENVSISWEHILATGIGYWEKTSLHLSEKEMDQYDKIGNVYRKECQFYCLEASIP